MSKHSLLFAIIISWFQLIYAAGPLEHAYLAGQFFDIYPKYNAAEKNEFLVGTLFPDIRYLGEASRANTHFKHMTMQEVLEETSPFMAGVKFHSYVDIVREKYVEQQNIYTLLPNMTKEHKATFLKLIEEQIIFKLHNWQYCIEALHTIYPQELTWGMDTKVVHKWHSLLIVAFSEPTSTILFVLTVAHQSFFNIPPDEIAVWSKIFLPIADSPIMHLYWEGMNLHIINLVKQNKS